MMSPALMPALYAGVSSSGLTTRRLPSVITLDLNAHAAELALRHLVEFFQVARPDHAGERIELLEGAVGEFADEHFVG